MTTPDERAAMAAELALGVLDGDEREEAMRRVLADPRFAREVEAWRTHFALLFAQWPDAVPSETVGARIAAMAAPGSMRSGSTVVAAPASRTGWAWATGLATLIAACLVLALALRPQRIVVEQAPVATGAAAPLIAAITPTKDGGDTKPFAASYDARTGEIRLAGGVDVPSGRSAQLWAIEAEGPPHPLGLLDGASSRVSIGGRDLRRMAPGVTLAVSIEPVGGSPTGLPTGPVVATGTLAGV